MDLQPPLLLCYIDGPREEPLAWTMRRDDYARFPAKSLIRRRGNQPSGRQGGKSDGNDFKLE